jgi:hypothetical protein
MVLRSKRTVGWLHNRRVFNPPKIFQKKGLTSAPKECNIKEQLEFNFNKRGQYETYSNRI